jgi:cytochrome c biogenesis protein CcmG/thiol:disulfide interchange protein DsbE
MTRSRLVTLVMVVAALVGALVYGLQDKPPTTTAADLTAVRAAAALEPCPSGISRDLPALTLPCLGGGAAVPLAGAPTGKPTLVNVYGSWCVPCQEEMPLLAAFSQATRGRLALVGVDTEDDPRLALLFAKDMRQTWPAVVDDDKQVVRRYASGPPVTLFVDRAGKVVHVKLGAFKRLVDLATLTRTYLGVSV